MALAQKIKHLTLALTGFRPIEEAISCAGGVKRDVLSSQSQLKTNPYVLLCGEMLDWDAPTGGYLLTACFATGRASRARCTSVFSSFSLGLFNWIGGDYFT